VIDVYRGRVALAACWVVCALACTPEYDLGHVESDVPWGQGAGGSGDFLDDSRDAGTGDDAGRPGEDAGPANNGGANNGGANNGGANNGGANNGGANNGGVNNGGANNGVNNTPVDQYHPDGYDESEVHSVDAKLQVEDCRECHGADLRGGTSRVSCDECHDDGWRTNCTFCHGGELNSTGAPPRDLDGTTDSRLISFAAHTAHVTGTRHGATACRSCHTEPTDVLTAGHMFDNTPGAVEVSLAGGLSPHGVWDGDGGCTSLYCHGNGRSENGTSHAGDASLTCDSCHPSLASGTAGWSTMSGDHNRHLRKGITCSECHNAVVRSGESISGPSLHVNGRPDRMFTANGFNQDASGRCSGFCHNEFHFFEGW